MEREYKFRALTSNKDVEIKPVTLKALEFAIDENSEVTNVAITGNYGAGKSSVVDSFELKIKNSSIFLWDNMMKQKVVKKMDLISVKSIQLKGK